MRKHILSDMPVNRGLIVVQGVGDGDATLDTVTANRLIVYVGKPIGR
jgi:hypothetical protein